MLDPGRYLAEAIYFLQYTLAQILWAIDRALLSIAIIVESVNIWITDNIGYFVQLLVNALSAPLGGLFILALTALGLWYALNTFLPTPRWVDPSKLATYGLVALFFFSSPIVVITMMEDLRGVLLAGVDATLIDAAAGDIFTLNMNGTDTGLPGAIPDVNSDGTLGSFDLAAAFMAVANLDELDNSEFPAAFEAIYFPFGDPAGIDLSDEADQELAKALAGQGIERLLFALIAIPTAVAEHFLRLSLTGVAIFLYLGAPIAMLLAFFVYTQAFLGAYLRQFVNLLIETFLNVIIVSVLITLLAAAAQEGIGLYIGASLIVFIVLLWRIKSALKLAATAFDLFGGALLTGGSGGMEVARMGQNAVMGTAALAGAAFTGGATLAAGGAVLGSAAALQADGRAGGAYLGTDPDKTDGRVRQLKTIAGYALGRSATARSVIEGSHEVRTLTRNFRDGEVQAHDPDTLDYFRTGSSMSGLGSSPWLAMRLSPSLRTAYDQIGGRRSGYGGFLDVFDEGGEPVGMNGAGNRYGNGRSPQGPHNSTPPDEDSNATSTSLRTSLWHEEPATSRQLAYLRQLGVDIPEDPSTNSGQVPTRGQASDLINQARQRQQTEMTGNDQSQPVNQDLANRFAGLEQALVTLTEALTDPDGTSRMTNGQVEEQADESFNAPILNRLPEDVGQSLPNETTQDVRIVSANPDANDDGIADEDEVHNVNIVSAAPDLDRDGREDKYEINEGTTTGTVRLETHNESRRQLIHDTLERNRSDPKGFLALHDEALRSKTFRVSVAL